MNTALVSVITPAYNAQDFIGQTIESVINQTYPHWEMLIVDDGSTDGTRGEVQKYLNDNRIKYLYQENQERSAARNNGIRHSSGKYVAFLDADDLWLPDKLRVQVEYLEKHPDVGLCFTGKKCIDGGGRSVDVHSFVPVVAKDQLYHLMTGNFISILTVMVPRFVFDKVGLFDETLPVFGAEDWDMWLRIVWRYPIHFINQPLALYRVHDSGTSLDNKSLCREAILRKMFSNPALPPRILKDKRKIIAAYHLGYSQTYLRANQRKKAFAHWYQAVKTYPQGLLILRRGLWATLKLLLPHPIISNLPAVEKFLRKKMGGRWVR